MPAVGAVLHTINFRLPREQTPLHHQSRRGPADLPGQVAWAALSPTCSASCPSVEKYILMDDRGPEPAGHCRSRRSTTKSCWRTQSEHAEFPELDENMAAGLCYTSGTTGEPKGVLYSHRSTFLHAMAGCMVDGGRDGRAGGHAARPCRCSTSTPGGCPIPARWRGPSRSCRARCMIGQPIAELIEGERVTCAAGVPTIWNLLYQHLKEKGRTTCRA